MAIEGSGEALYATVELTDIEKGDAGSRDQPDAGQRRNTSRSNRNTGNRSNNGNNHNNNKRNSNSSGHSNGLQAVRKNVDGLMDIALLSANANQLRFLLSYNTLSPTYIVSLVLVTLSLAIQIGIGLLYIIRTKMRNFLCIPCIQTDDVITGGIFLVIVINVLAITFTNTQTANAN